MKPDNVIFCVIPDTYVHVRVCMCEYAYVCMHVCCAMAEEVSRRPVTAEARVRALVNPCRICGGQSGIGTGFLRVLQFLCQYYSTVALDIHLSSRG
jgi:hypothetical protein